jgi:hypothetical protein
LIIKKLKVNVKDKPKSELTEFKSTMFAKNLKSKAGKKAINNIQNIKTYKTDTEQISDEFEFDSYRYSYSLEV